MDGDRGNAGIGAPWTGRGVALFILAIAASYLVARLLWPFLPAIVTSAVLAALVYPAHRVLERRVRSRRSRRCWER